jgi:hypothetical protein
MTAVVIACGGRSRRWGDYPTPKHLLEVDGERLLDRTIRQASTFADVFVAGPYDVPGRVDLEPHPLLGELNKFYDSRHVWAERTVILFGDVYYTDEAMSAIADAEDEWVWVSRFGASDLTGCTHGEGFAQVFTESAQERHVEMLFRAAELKRRGVLNRAIGWEHYRLMAGGDPKPHRDYGMRLEIDDWTEDFDYPAEYETWLQRREHVHSGDV